MDWSLFLAAFLSSTLLPGGSEALLLLYLNEGASPYATVLIATVGNVLGSVLTYAIGRAGNASIHQRWLSISKKNLANAEIWFNRYGSSSLLLAWLPIIGDPLCLIAGLLRYQFIIFLLLITLGKAARYMFIAWAFL
ncbi:MAG: YqaA family protein [Mariprofundaceae bacterium]